MNGSSTPRHCRCGTRLARDNSSYQCAACQSKARTLVMQPPDVPAEFWVTDHMQDALATWNMGRVIAAYRSHPHHGRPVPQEIVAGWVGLTQAQLSRIENGLPIKDLDKLIQWARTLGVPADLLWFKLPEQLPDQAYAPKGDRDLAIACYGQQELPEIDDMNRRELLRLMSMAGTLTAATELEDRFDWERLSHFATGMYRLDPATVDEYAALNLHSWRVFALSRTKSNTFPLVREQLDVLVQALQRSQGSDTHQRLCGLASDLFQLAGEILFDGNQYTEAAHCYTLAATASKQAGAYDLWACALTRHSFIGVYERQFAKAAPMLELAAGLARRGDGNLSTRYWVSAVQAEAFAGLGDLDACQRALDHAEHVHQLSGQIHNGGWLRFDGSRLAEERGTCYVALQRPDLAEAALSDALNLNLSYRRRGSVLTDLAMLGVKRQDVNQLVTYANAALDTARQAGSGVIGRKLQGLQPHLAPFLTNRQVRQLNREIIALAGVPA
jgi:transcriptional regulator with XRE-family HTH domain